MLFLRHPAWLWLKKYDKLKLPPVDENLQTMFDSGNKFESYANQLFPGSTKIGFNNYDEYMSLPSRTLEAIKNNASTILQGRLEAEGITCIFDVLQQVGENEFDLIEIKASTKAKPEHEYDLAFQLTVLEKSGYKVRNIFIIHANKEYVRNGEIDPKGITAQTDVSDKVKALREITKQQIKAAFKVLEQRKMPDPSLRYVNQIDVPSVEWFKEWLAIYKTLKPNPDPYNIYELSYPTAEQIGKLEDADITQIANIPEELALREKQVAQIKTTRENKRIFDKEKIQEFLNTFQYPLYFFDYETMSSVIPQFDGLSPYQDYPFQYSLHVLESPTSELKHFEYLHNENTNPMPGLLAQLKKDIGSSGTILTWNMSYEKGCNKRMAEIYPEYADFLSGVNERINDLMIPFSEIWFFDKDFFGSASVKKVMPVMAPELSYKELNVGEGLLARRTWTQTVLEGNNQADRDAIMSDLSRYCTLDTFAMVRILEELKKLILE
jgi:CRISPR/Cas system-associated exonuclease Cas4 (RecB family)